MVYKGLSLSITGVGTLLEGLMVIVVGFDEKRNAVVKLGLSLAFVGTGN